MRVMTQIQQLLCIFVKHLPGVGQNAFPRRPVKQSLAQLILQLPDGLAHRRLRPV
jgi:hypothetical protein